MKCCIRGLIKGIRFRPRYRWNNSITLDICDVRIGVVIEKEVTIMEVLRQNTTSALAGSATMIDHPRGKSQAANRYHYVTAH